MTVCKNTWSDPLKIIRSELKDIDDAPMFYTEAGAPQCVARIAPSLCKDGLDRMQVGDEIIVITWLHLARRDVLQVHPPGEPGHSLDGRLFNPFTRSSPSRWAFVVPSIPGMEARIAC